MKTFFNLVQEVQKPGLCHRCGGCVTFCTAVNYGALELDEDGKPRYADMEKCIECGLCYAICPEIDELEEDARREAAWREPMGRVIEAAIARATDPVVRGRATDGGAVTAVLLHLFDTGRIDGAIVARPNGNFQRRPSLATSRAEIVEAAGFFFDTSHGMNTFSEAYQTYSSIEAFAPMMRKGLRRVALVGTPCQIKSLRRMQVLGILPADDIKFCLGLFCSGNFIFREEERAKLSDIYDFSWDEVVKLNVKEHFMIHLKSGTVRTISLNELDFMRRYACRYCDDYSAEFADIAFGGIGASQGWTTVITRTPLGRAVFADARGNTLEEMPADDPSCSVGETLKKVEAWSRKKRQTAVRNRKTMGPGPVRFKS